MAVPANPMASCAKFRVAADLTRGNPVRIYNGVEQPEVGTGLNSVRCPGAKMSDLSIRATYPASVTTEVARYRISVIGNSGELLSTLRQFKPKPQLS